MKTVLRSLVTATTILAVIVVPVAAVSAAPKQVDRPGLQSGLDDVLAVGAVGALAEVRDQRGVWRGTSGVAKIVTGQAVPADGRFRAGSITKTFVATVVLQLVGEGELRLDDTVEKWLPGVVPDGRRITVRHLLNHTSGVYDVRYTFTLPPEPQFLDNRWRTWTATELIQRAVANPATFEPPGSQYKYSNTNYLLLGQIVKQVTGRTAAEEIKRRLIRPLGLHGTTMPGTSPRIPGPHPHGYVPIRQNEQIRLVDYTHVNPSFLGIAGEMISTTKDLNQFFAALLGGRLLPRGLLAEMKTPAVEGRRYGLGLAWLDTSCGRVYGNDGDALTYQSWSFSTPDVRRQVTVALTPDHSRDLDDAVEAFVERAVCA